MDHKKFTKRRLNASLTIEMSLIISFVLLLFMGLVLSVFYHHDKNILHGAAYETAVVGCLKVREKEEITEAELEAFCRERLKRKCIFMTNNDIEVNIQEKEIAVHIISNRKGYRISVTKLSALTEPEKKIRDVRRLKIKNGKKNYD